MKALFVFIVFLLPFSQLMGNAVMPEGKVVLEVENRGDSQDSGNRISLDDENKEMEFIAADCSPVLALVDHGETIYTGIVRIKSQFYFSMWRPPRA